jgi:hypothetical protein
MGCLTDFENHSLLGVHLFSAVHLDGANRVRHQMSRAQISKGAFSPGAITPLSDFSGDQRKARIVTAA